MKRRILLFILIVFLSRNSFTQYITALDNAANYSTWENNSNGGFGFGDWSLWTENQGGHFLGSSAVLNFGNIDTESKAFGMWGNPSGTNVSNAQRLFANWSDGASFSVQIATAYRNGFKGIDLFGTGFEVVWNFNVGGNNYTAGSTDQTSWSYSQTSIFTLTATQNGSNINISLTRGSDNYSTTINNKTLIGFKFYVGSTESGDLNNLFFNNLKIEYSDPSKVPSVASVRISSNPTLSTSLSCSNLTIPSGTSLTVNNSATLTVSGTLSNLGTLTIKSDATGTGSLIHSSSGVNATVERYFAGSEQWRLVSSPVASQSISGGWTPAGTYDPPHNVGYDFYAWDEVTSTWLNQRIAGNNITSFVPAKGYLVSFQETDPTKHFSGELNTGSVSISLTKTGSGDYSGTNLVGNPYPSSIDWKAASGWSRSILKDDDAGEGVGYTMYIYNPSANNYGAYISNSSSDEGTHGVTRYIPPMQGFFVVASSAGSFGMDNNVRVHNNAGNFLKNKGAEPNIIRASVTGTNVGSDEVMIEIGNKQGGAPKWNSMVATAPSLWVAMYDKRYSIYFHHNNQQTESLPVSFKAGANGQYTLSFDFAQGQYHTLKLQDLKTNTIHDLLAANSYAFSATTTDDPNRFLLVFGTVGVDEKPAATAQLQAYMANGLLWVNNPAEKSQLAVFDLSGRLLMQRQLRSKGLQQLSLNLQKGAYILRLTEGNSSLSTKVINQ